MGRPLLWAAVMLTSGTCTTLAAKLMFELKADGRDTCDYDDDGRDDDTKHCAFAKPWFSVLIMKVAMSFCLLGYYAVGFGRPTGRPEPPTKALVQCWLPALLDLLNTVLGNVGLVWVSSSIYQMTRGSVVIFSAILSVKWLGNTLRQFHLYSIALVVVAVIMVGTAGTQSDGGTGASFGEIIAGLALILLAQLVCATQIICEERLMNRLDIPPVLLVGMEGAFGCAFFVILAPILTATPASSNPVSILWHEDFIDSFIQLGNSSSLVLVCLGYFVTILAYNVSCNNVTQLLSAVVRSILEACRTLGVWAVSLVIYYSANGSTAESVGESWSKWSYLELAGFAVLLYGTFGYKALVKLPCVSEAEYDAEQIAQEEARIHAAKVAADKLSLNDPLTADNGYSPLDGREEDSDLATLMRESESSAPHA